ncbi:MAG: ABC transporter ATP-binding protein [Candidatus Levybacteria bacterium]|nr:ABC transporter ATP-binding protein [Candidatus Levybacteria bacterium]
MFNTIPKGPLSFGLYITKFHKKWALMALISVFIATGFDRSSVIILKNLTDSITMDTIVMGDVWFWAIAYPLVLLAAHLFWRSSGFIGMRWFMNFRTSSYQALYNYITLHSKDFFSSRFAGALTNKMSNAVDGTESIFETILWQFIPLFIGLIWYVIIAWNESYLLGLIIAVWATIFVTLNMWFAKKLQPRSYKSAEAVSNLKGRIVDSLANISLVHEYANVKGERNYILRYIHKHREAGLLQWSLSEWILTVNGILIFLFVLLMVGTSVSLLQSGAISVGSVVMVIAIVSNLYGQFLFIGQEMRDTAKYYGQAKEGLHEILHEHTITDAPNAKKADINKGEIKIDSIDFQYENKKIFTNFSLHIPAGQKVGFVGRSGAGKTTFVSLLLRHFEVNQGNILLDGHNISQITLHSLRRAIAFVPQDTSLFHRSIRENIRYSNEHATDEAVILAAQRSEASEFIESLPHGYDTLVGERGVKLSGGQRQRIAIARAFLKDAPIVILDEATSSLDSQSEHAIQDSIEKLMKHRTVIAIAHRLSTLKKMDRIVVIADGKVIEDGLPDELLKKPNGVFKNMWDHQVNGFIIDD